MTFDPVTPKSKGFHCFPGRKVGQGVLELLIGNGFGALTPETLTFDLVFPKSTRVLCYL